MSETTAAIFILPTLAALVLVLECSRVGCTRLTRRLKAAPAQQGRRSSDADTAASAF